MSAVSNHHHIDIHSLQSAVNEFDSIQNRLNASEIDPKFYQNHQLKNIAKIVGLALLGISD